MSAALHRAWLDELVVARRRDRLEPWFSSVHVLEQTLVPALPPGPPGVAAAENFAQMKLGPYSAYLPALEAAWRVGNRVVEELVRGWAKYREMPPRSD